VAVDDVSFDVHAGEIFGLIGSDDAGKIRREVVLASFRRRKVRQA
jgi:ABC-type Na+ transport system ATPase subunit NatA